MAGDAPLASNGIAGVGGWRGGCVGAAPRGQGQVIRVTPGPRLSLWSGLGRRRCRHGEEDDTMAGVADTWGQVGSDSRRSRKARGREQRARLASGSGCCRADKLGWLAGLAAAARWRAEKLLLLFFFPFSVFHFFSFV